MIDKNIWEGWEVLEQIGSGGFSKVYKMRKLDDDEDFCSALKVVSIPQDSGEYGRYISDGYDHESITSIFKSQADRIVSEFKLMRKFRGTANIVNYEDHRIIERADTHGWDILIRMELLTPLHDYYANHPFDERTIIKLGTDICTALELCEKFNVVHRDIKPQNIFVNNFGDFKLGDFGIARVMDHATRATRVGTPSYIAPEVYNNSPSDRRADIYCLGMVLYWLLNERRLPFAPLPPAHPTSASIEEANMMRLSGQPITPPKNGSPALKAAVMKALAFNPNERFSSASEFKAALTAKAPAWGVSTVTDNGKAVVIDKDKKSKEKKQSPSSGQQQKKKNKGLIAVILALVLLFVSGGVIVALLLSNNDNLPPPEDSNHVAVTESSEEESTKDASNEDSTISVNTEDSESSESNGSNESSTEEESSVVLGQILLRTAPKKTRYFVGEELDTDGLTLTLEYSNGSTESTDEGFSCDPTSFDTAGEHTVTVNYEDFTVSFTVTVEDVEVSSISVEKVPNDTIYVGGTVNTDGLELKVIYSDGSEETVDSDFTCTPTSFDSAGEHTVTVTYGGKTATFTVEVEELEVESISVKTKPSDTSYFVGENIDTAGLKITVYYSDGTREDITSGFTCSPTSFSSAGTKTVTVTYGEKTATFTVDVEAIEVESISVKSKPSDTSYFVGESLNTAGLKITVYYSDGTREDITSGFTCSPTSFSSTGTKAVTVEYGGKNTTFNVTVVQREVERPSGNQYGSPVVVPAGKTNSAAGASSTISKNLTDTDDASLFLPDASGANTYEYWGDSNRTRLTDGITAAGADMGPNGSLEGVTVSFVGTNAIYEYVIDLGETKTDINSIVFCGVRDGFANKQNRGFNTATTMIYVSDSLGSWGSKLDATFSSQQLPNAPYIKHQEYDDVENIENYTYTYTLNSAASGRYVRILASSPVYCLQFDEIMVLN